MRCVCIQYAIDEQADEVVQLTLQVIVLPYPEQIGVRLQDVQMGIHGLSLVGILVAEAHVGHFFPFAGQRFAISVFLSVGLILNRKLTTLSKLSRRQSSACGVLVRSGNIL